MTRLRVLFVCTGNTCRSPMAMAILGRLLKKQGKTDVVEIWSAGIAAHEGAIATGEARKVMRELGLDLEGHVARQVSREDLRRADLVFTMTEAHRLRLLETFDVEGLPDKTHVLKGYTALRTGKRDGSDNGIGLDIQDPFGMGIEQYRQTRDELWAVLEATVPALLGRTAGGTRGEHELTIGIGSDHAGYLLKDKIREFLESEGFAVEDVGTNSADSVDYPDFARKVAEGVAAGRFDRGVLICGTGIGMCIAANKVPGVRAALCHDVYSARLTREHNDANVLTMGARVIGEGLATAIVDAWVNAEFVGGRHARRVGKIAAMETPRGNNDGEG